MKNKSLTTLAWVTYPAVMAFVIALHLMMKNLGADLFVATYVPSLIGAALVTVFEWLSPARLRWHPDRSDIASDLSFMVVVQVLLPPALSLLLVFALVEPLHNLQLVSTDLWPHYWPTAGQALLMLLAADLLRYWFHVACHKNPWLWRLHEVHHSPNKLYWLNVGRFHPLEKALQFLFDSLPFILLGVDKQVIALYFVFYSVNGFFQHCNIRLRFGVLNYVISSAELHRWHHSKLPKEADNNYGNNLIIWDLVFGTWFLPRNRSVGPLGVRDPKYPKSFAAQLGAPFRRIAKAAG